GAVGELRAHHRAREVHAQRCDVRAEAVVGGDRLGDLLRVFRAHPVIHVLAPVGPGPPVEAAVAHGRQVVGHQVRADLVTLVDHSPELPAARLDGQCGGVAQAGGIGAVHAGFGVDLPDHGAVGLGDHAAFGDVAVGADADVQEAAVGAGGHRLGPVVVDLRRELGERLGRAGAGLGLAGPVV